MSRAGHNKRLCQALRAHLSPVVPGLPRCLEAPNALTSVGHELGYDWALLWAPDLKLKYVRQCDSSVVLSSVAEAMILREDDHFAREKFRTRRGIVRDLMFLTPPRPMGCEEGPQRHLSATDITLLIVTFCELRRNRTPT